MFRPFMIKCDGRRPTCTSCLRLGKTKGWNSNDIDCVYPPPSKWAQAANKILEENKAELKRLKAVEDLETRLQSFEHKLSLFLEPSSTKDQMMGMAAEPSSSGARSPSLSLSSSISSSSRRDLFSPPSPSSSSSCTSSVRSQSIPGSPPPPRQFEEYEDLGPDEALQMLLLHFPTSSMLDELALYRSKAHPSSPHLLWYPAHQG
ncbi:hypothetical protein BT69DRAFT_381233 [Atractiella rhizophila]|nr:hypothetical protein BT69DRAFT_381233 [Atractiella rhizophila]